MSRGRHTALRVSLTPAERATLQRWQRARRLPARQVRRGRLVLLRAGGMSIAQIARLVGVSRKAVSHAVWRFHAGGLAGLQTRGPGRAAGQEGDGCPASGK